MSDEDPHEKINPGATRRLYFEDAYGREFEATVIEKRIHEGSPAVVLDQTCFYPESGGQPWDAGTLGGAEVLQVLDLDGPILHVLKEDVPPGPVSGRIDWTRRFDHMQQHTGQHILSQAFFELLKGETLAFHLGQDVSTLEIGLRALSDEESDRVEDRANAIVWQDREIKTYFVPEERIDEIPLRRPPKKQGLLRVVEVAGFDYSACGGTHCRRSGEVGLIKILGIEKIRGHVRFEFLCGSRALADYRLKDRGLRKIAGAFSCLPKDAAAHVEKLTADGKALRKRLRGLQERLASFEAQEIIRQAPGRLIAAVLPDKSPDEARFLALNITRSGEFAVLYGVAGESQGHLIFARSEALAADLRGLIPVVGAVVPVKGGGGPSLVELVTPDKDKLGAAIEAARAWLEDREAALKGR
jgi:alanyl-tRNA synthetase